MKIKFKLKWNRSAMYEIRRAPGVVGFLEAKGSAVRNSANQTLQAGQGYEMSSRQGRKGPPGYQGRWAVRVYTSSDDAKRSEATNNTLLRLLG